MSTYILVHGGLSGSWYWNKIIPLLEDKGHKVIAPDLPGHGEDKTPISDITLQAYVDRICDVIDAQSEPVILVGHSMGGFVITQTAEFRPDKIKLLIYLAAYLLQNGEAPGFIDDPESLVVPNVIMSEDGSYITFKKEAFKEVFADDCSDEDIRLAQSHLCPQGTLVNITPVSTTEENFGRVPRVYIECLRDRALSPSIQKRMYTALPCKKVITMDTSHSPFLSKPEELVSHLLSL